MLRDLNVGIDISKQDIHCCLLSNDVAKYLTVENSVNGFNILLDECNILQSKNPFFLYESTARYGDNLKYFLHNNGLKQLQENPRKTANFIKVIGTDKTDKKDSFYLAQYCKFLPDHKFTTVCNNDFQSIQKINNSLELLERVRTQLNNNIKSQPTSITEYDQMLKDELSNLKKLTIQSEKRLSNLNHDLHLKTFGVYKDLLLEYKGIGRKTLFLTLSKIYELVKNDKSFNSLIAFFGLNPISYQSGKTLNLTVLNKFANPYIKKVLFLSAMSAILSNEHLKAYYEEQTKTKPKKKVLVLVMKKIVKYIYLQVKKDLGR